MIVTGVADFWRRRKVVIIIGVAFVCLVAVFVHVRVQPLRGRSSKERNAQNAVNMKKAPQQNKNNRKVYAPPPFIINKLKNQKKGFGWPNNAGLVKPVPPQGKGNKPGGPNKGKPPGGPGKAKPPPPPGAKPPQPGMLPPRPGKQPPGPKKDQPVADKVQPAVPGKGLGGRAKDNLKPKNKGKADQVPQKISDKEMMEDYEEWEMEKLRGQKGKKGKEGDKPGKKKGLEDRPEGKDRKMNGKGKKQGKADILGEAEDAAKRKDDNKFNKAMNGMEKFDVEDPDQDGMVAPGKEGKNGQKPGGKFNSVVDIPGQDGSFGGDGQNRQPGMKVNRQGFGNRRDRQQGRLNQPRQGQQPGPQGQQPGPQGQQPGPQGQQPGPQDQWNRPAGRQQGQSQFNRPNQGQQGQWNRPVDQPGQPGQGQLNRPRQNGRGQPNQWNQGQQGQQNQWNRPNQGQQGRNQWNQPNQGQQGQSNQWNQPNQGQPNQWNQPNNLGQRNQLNRPNQGQGDNLDRRGNPVQGGIPAQGGNQGQRGSQGQRSNPVQGGSLGQGGNAAPLPGNMGDPLQQRKGGGGLMGSNRRLASTGLAGSPDAYVNTQTPVGTPPSLKRTERQEAVVAAFRHSWDGYVKYAWGKDELNPLSHSGARTIFGMGLTIVDSLDTLWIMGLREEYQRARAWVAESLDIVGNRNTVSVFETTIRVLGGLLSAFHLTGDKMYLDKATQLGARLLPAFATASGIPASSVNLATGEHGTGTITVAEAGTLQLEFRDLYRATGNETFKRACDNALDRILVASEGRMVPMTIDVRSGRFLGAVYSAGAGVDSYYEYLLKQWLQSGKTEAKFRDAYVKSTREVLSSLVFTTKPHNMAYLGVKATRQGMGSTTMDHLSCFYPGMLALGVMNQVLPESQPMAKNLTHTCYYMYNITKPTHLAPEIFRLNVRPGEKDVLKSSDPQNIQRPETVESLFYLYRLTKEQKYRQWAWKIFEAFRNSSKLDGGGYASLTSVYGKGQYKDRMESFFLAETLKYLFLIFQEDESFLSLDEWVFNTEAHPLPIWKVT